MQYPQWGARFLGKPEQDWPESSEFIAHFGQDGLERAQRSLRFVLAHNIDTVIPGLRSTKQVDYVVKVAEDFEGLTFEEKEDFGFEELPLEPFCRECKLCMPCPDGVEITRILRWNTYFSSYNIRKWTREHIKS